MKRSNVGGLKSSSTKPEKPTTATTKADKLIPGSNRGSSSMKKENARREQFSQNVTRAEVASMNFEDFIKNMVQTRSELTNAVAGPFLGKLTALIDSYLSTYVEIVE